MLKKQTFKMKQMRTQENKDIYLISEYIHIYTHTQKWHAKQNKTKPQSETDLTI